jgi:hypothetical protein
MSEREFHPLVKQLLDGDITIADLPAELRAEGEEALRLLAVVDRRPVALPAVPLRVRRSLTRAPQRSAWRPWVLAPALALAAALVLWLGQPGGSPPPTMPEGVVTVRFVLAAPDARQVSVAGTFNQWDPRATPLVRTGSGVWTATLRLPAGQHQYAFVVDGERWVPDPAAPAVDDGFGRRNSVLTL